MPETAEAAVHPISLVEGLPRGEIFNKVGQRAETFLQSKDARAIKSLSAYIDEEYGQQAPPERSTETFLALRDKRTNTSFVISSRPGIERDERIITIRFQAVGEHKGELGGGVIRLTYKNGQPEPIDMQTEKADNVHLLQFSDEMWFNGDPAIYSDIISKEHTELSYADVAELFGRLASEEIETDTALTQNAAKHADLNHRLGDARSKLENARRKGNQEEFAQAEQAFHRVLSEWELLWQEILQRLRPVTQVQTEEKGDNGEDGRDETQLEQAREELAKIGK